MLPPLGIAATQRPPHTQRPGDHRNSSNHGLHRLSQPVLTGNRHCRDRGLDTPRDELDSATERCHPRQQFHDPHTPRDDIATCPIQAVQTSDRRHHQHRPSENSRDPACGIAGGRSLGDRCSLGFAGMSQITACQHARRLGHITVHGTQRRFTLPTSATTT
ncbi:Uncharacterised protein [Mycobacteroides abscessus]|nr:Uncharacterised protein [Mycobacteroides abscessus]SII89587.1 Uncharacterised protein [Mycobacteroides abscessus subsp. abscessus]SIN10992.1 Uncharacterised protein [Mycobacteroides abscessus subsp. abscessus]